MGIPMQMSARILLVAFLVGCTATTPDSVTPPPPPNPPAPPPVPLVLVVNPLSRRASAQPGGTIPGDNAAITLSGDNSAQATWTASNKHSWLTLTTASGTGSGTATWTRNSTGLAAGIYVDTIQIAVTGATGSPTMVIDSLQITTAPVPLALVVSPLSRSVSATQGSNGTDDNIAITLSGDGAAPTAWSAAKRKSWTALAANGGTGSGSLTWHRATAALAVGTYVDTITITAPGASNSPINVIDTVKITPPPVPLTLAVSPASRNVSVIVGSAATATSAAVTLAGDNSTTTTWSATRKKSWTTITTASGTGSGTVVWSRNVTGLAAGTYVDTLSISATGATGSPATVIDSVIVTAQSSGLVPDLGLNANLNGKRIFPANDPWNQPVDTAQVDPSSVAILALIGATKSLHPDFGSDPSGTFGYSYIVVPDGTPRYTVGFDYSNESDPGPYPIPANPPIEQGSDGHLFVITQNEWKLYELYSVYSATAPFSAGSGAIFDMTNGTQRPAGWTSADAAGLPMIPGMVRYEEVYLLGAITHAIRFTITHSRQAYIAPATHFASPSTNPLYLPMGARVRLRASFDITGYPAPMQVILRALKKYGMMVADNGGDFFMSGVTDLRWDNDVNNLLKQVKVGDFEVVKMNGIVTQ